MNSLPLIVISGPTASGKTNLAIDTALEFNAEIISADSRQIYRQMEIGTASPTQAELNLVPHHFIGIFDPDIHYSAGEFGNECRKCIDDIRKRGKNIIICGGSGMYIQAIFGMIYEGKKIDSTLRNKIQKEGNDLSWQEMYKRLDHIDPDYCNKISENDIKRISRGWEIYHSSGNIPSKAWKLHSRNYNPKRIEIGLSPEKYYLLERINIRVDQMIKNGFISECQSLVKTYPVDLNSLNTVGYKELISYLNNEITLNEAIDWIKIHTRQFAKRQRTWFRRYPAHHSIEYNNDKELQSLKMHTLSYIKQSI